jgi:butyryl-CoA dehydrogenase
MIEKPVSEHELEEFRATVRRFATDALAAKAAHWDEREEFPAENRALLARLGYLGLVIPEEHMHLSFWRRSPVFVSTRV